MKLHLPRALRGALLATLSLSCTAPVWAGWHGTDDYYMITQEDIDASAAHTLNITTAHNNPSNNGWWLRSYYDNSSFAVLPGATTLTIDSLTLAKPTGGNKYTFNIQGHWDKAACNFTDLTINNIRVGSSFDITDPITLNVASGNVLTLGGVDGNLSYTVGGNLFVSADDCTHGSIGGSGGTVTFTDGWLDISGHQAYDQVGEWTVGSPSGYTGQYKASGANVTITLDFETSPFFKVKGSNGVGGYIERVNSTSYKLVMEEDGDTSGTDTPTAPDGTTAGLYAEGVTSTPTINWSSTGNDVHCLGQLKDADGAAASTDATKEWKLTLSGTLTTPSDDKDVILLSSTSSLPNSDKALVDHKAGDFCLYLTPTGELVLHSQANVPNTAPTTQTLSSALAEGSTWTEGSYNIVITYKAIGYDPETSSYLFGVYFAKESTLTLDGTAVALPTSGEGENATRVDRFISMAGATPDVDLLNNLYVRLPEQSTIKAEVDKDSPACGGQYWKISEDIYVEQLVDGSLRDFTISTPTSAYLSATDSIRFEGGSLTCMGMEDSEGEFFDTIFLPNIIESTPGNAVKFQVTEGITLVLEKGQGALESDTGLEVSGGGTLMLEKVTSEAPSNITLGENTGLSFAGPSTLTIDPTKNSFDATAGMHKDDGGTLVYLGSTAATQDDEPTPELSLLSNPTGTVEIRQAATLEFVNAKTLSLLEDGTKLTVTDDVRGTNLLMGDTNGFSDRSTTLEADTVILSGRADVGPGATITTRVFKADGILLGGDASINVGDGHLEVTGKNQSVDVFGKLVSDGIEVTKLQENVPANFKGLVLTADSLAADSLKNTHVTVGQPATASLQALSPTTVLELGSVSNSLIEGYEDTLIRNSALTSSSIEFSAGQVQLANCTLDGNSSVSHTGDGGTIGLSQVKVEPGTTISAGESTYTIANGASDLAITGTASASALTLSGLVLDTSDTDTPVNGETFITTDKGKIDITGCNIKVYTAPGLVGEVVVAADGSLQYSTEDRSDSLFSEIATTANSQAARPVIVENAKLAGGELSALYDDILDSSHIDTAERQGILEALTSGSVTMLADSQRRGVVNTINALRNRVIQMGHAQGIETETSWNAWIEADGSYNDISGDDAAGYEFNTWGGTVGAHADVGHFSFGAAISAAYGELTADSADNASGNNDTINASAFIRHQKGNWVQMGILSVGMNEMDMERTVGDYKATGDTNGMTVTAYYEAGYTYALGDSGSQVIQPLVSLMLTSAQMDAFSESGSIGNAGLMTEDEEYFYGTLGIGARYQTVLSQDINERISFIEVRAKIVQDFGDDTHEASVRFAGAPGSPFVLQGTEAGSFGFQFGAGISVPLGLQTTFFADVDADIRDNATSVSGSAGVRVAF